MSEPVQSQQVTAKSGSNLAAAFVLLPKAKREAMTALYAFCRKVDDVADDDDIPLAKRREGLQVWRDDVRTICDGGEPTHQICRELAPFVQRHQLPFNLFDELIAGMESDLDKVRYADLGELKLYCYRAASVVGLLTVRILGCELGQADAYAENIGQALQLTNILRDVAEDAERGRIYLPQSLLEKHGVGEQAVIDGESSVGFENVARELADRAWAYYKLSAETLPVEHRQDLLILEAMGGIYWRLLQKMRQIDFNVLSDERKKIRLGKWAKLAIGIQTKFAVRFRDYRPVYAREGLAL